MLKIDELRKQFKGKKVLITGHTGFKGPYAALLFDYLMADVYGYALKPCKNSLYDIIKNEFKKNGETLFKSECIADIRDYEKLKAYIKKVSPDYIIHMAAQALVIDGYDDPKYTYDVNVMGTVNVMNAVNEVFGKSKKVVSVLNVTTDKVYENLDIKSHAFKENEKLCGKDPYSNSKSCSELVTYSYKQSFFDKDGSHIRVSTARAGNVIGGGDISKNRIIPDCFRAYVANKSVVLRNPNSTRPYQFVLEPIIMYANILAYQMKDKKYMGSYNIGPDKKSIITTKELAKKFMGCFFAEDKVICSKVNKGVKEAKFLCLDNSLIKKVFSYKEMFDINKTITFTAEVYDLIRCKMNIVPYIRDLFTRYFFG